MKQPNRAHVITIRIGGDTPEDIMDALRQIVFDFSARGVRPMISGGVSSGWSIDYTEDLDMTPEKYAQAMKEYLDELVAV